MDRKTYSTGTRWESVVGYSRALRAGGSVFVSGTTSTNAEGEVAAAGDAYEQTRLILGNIATALGGVDARLEDVVRTRIYVTDIARWEEVGRAHGEVFGEIRPATSMVEVSALIHPDMLVEIEAHAIVAS